ncbi:MAG: hypothetical protein QHH13_08075 [Melioribacter sp.]|nr:hypothetical protein [Melioribacter sp.]
MAITIYKYAYHIDWDTEGIGFVRRTSGGSGVNIDLSNYYTKTDLQIYGSSQIHFGNIIEAYHNNLLDIQGGLDTSSGDSSGIDAEYYHLDASTYYDIIGISFNLSIEKDSINAVHLVNDEENPGPGKYYGTADDSVGAKGWFDLPKGGGAVLPFQTASFANPLNIDCSTYKDWICIVTDDCTVNLNNCNDGDAGMLELIIDGSSSGAELTITFGNGWSKKMGLTDLDMKDGADNIISWRAIGDGSTQEIVYTIGIIEV